MVQTTNARKGPVKTGVVRIIPWLGVRIPPVLFGKSVVFPVFLAVFEGELVGRECRLHDDQEGESPPTLRPWRSERVATGNAYAECKRLHFPQRPRFALDKGFDRQCNDVRPQPGPSEVYRLRLSPLVFDASSLQP